MIDYMRRHDLLARAADSNNSKMVLHSFVTQMLCDNARTSKT